MVELLFYEVVIRNELTSEIMTMQVSSFGPAEAQTEALVCAFKSHGWRKAVALLPEQLHTPVHSESVA